ncbi:C4-dicarboxylate transport protein [Raoultella planticola]|uniref:C4-dicarboxylate transport protein n=1 Tax=Raoultella planticola TaxID=575 RepID=A0A485AAT7_RAOPL|nr:C4-dicarboxylate transport protein [Raoultella planticola]
MASANKLTLFIVIFMLLGILSGAVIHAYASPGTITSWAENITLFTDMFLRLIKMVIAPLVFSTLTVGIMRLGETATIGRVGGKAMVWFITSSILSILVGLVIVTLEHPGAGLNLAIPKESVDTGLAVSGMSLKGFLSHTIPTSITEAMANNEILQIVVFSMFFGIAGASLGGEIQRAAGRRAERRLSYHAEGHRICDVRGSVGYFCRDFIGYRLAGDGHFA